MPYSAHRIRPTGDSLIHPMLVCVIQVEVHLFGIRVAEPTHFEIDDNQATKSPMKKEEIDPGTMHRQCEASSVFPNMRSQFSEVLKKKKIREMLNEQVSNYCGSI